MKSGIIVHVFRSDLGDCTNKGISSRFNQFVLLLPEGGPFEPSENMPALKLIDKSPYFYVIEAEVEVSDRGFSGQMMGGNFVYSSDSRFPNRFPIPVHDRKER